MEDEKHNFEMLNMPADHPARDMQDTFYITKDTLMRTHMSPNEARDLESHDFANGPIKMISQGVFIVVIQMTQHIHISSTKWKVK